MLTFMVPPNRLPSTRAIGRHRLPDLVGTWQRPTMIQSIMQLERSYFRHLRLKHDLELCPIDLLTLSWELAVKTSRPRFSMNFNSLSFKYTNSMPLIIFTFHQPLFFSYDNVNY